MIRVQLRTEELKTEKVLVDPDVGSASNLDTDRRKLVRL